ncbi:hypothetical protein [Cryobacterium sp. GrIS_2_6]|uniref:hypothetical protein n=1 Tax=Cryobacterium sp. GrIS_2_6 TaxID=3162785 RepID=UPI002E02E636|nr:hypothetical protein [Cryobacterium psychrotolerans]
MQLLVLGPSAINPDPSSHGAQQRELFARASGDLLDAPVAMAGRENAIELIARAAAAGIRIATISDGWPGQTEAQEVELDLRSAAGVDVGPLVDVSLTSVVLPGERDGEAEEFSRRIRALHAFLAAQPSLSQLERVVVLDSGVRGTAGRELVIGALRELVEHRIIDVVVVDPGPWGLTLGSCSQACRAIRIDSPAPNPRAQADEGEVLF